MAIIAFLSLLAVQTPLPLNQIALFSTDRVLAQTSTSHKAEAARLLKQGIEQVQTSQFKAAEQSWRKALIIYREIKDRQGEGNVLANLGLVYDSQGDYTKAIEYYQQSLAILQKIKDRLGEEAVLSNLGLAYNNLGDSAKAIEYYQQSLAIAKDIKDRLGEGTSLSNLGLAYDSQGDYAKAIDYHQQHLAIARAIKDRLGEGNALSNLGITYADLGDYTKAIESHQQRLAVARSIKDRLGEGNALSNLGIAYYRLGDYAKAIDYQQQRLAIARDIKDRLGERTSLANLGVVYQALGNYAKAIDYQQQSLAIAREIKDRLSEENALSNLGIAYQSLGNYPKAIEYQQQSLAITQEIKDRLNEGNAFSNLGLAYYELGDYTKAIDYHQRHLAITKDIKDLRGEGRALANLGIAYYELEDYAKAISYQQQRLVIAREIGDLQLERIALSNLGLTLQKSGNLKEAERILRSGVDVYEFLRKRSEHNKVSISEEPAPIYRTLQQVLIAENKPDAALEVAERERATAFAELLARRNTTISASKEVIITPPKILDIQQIAKQQNATLIEYSIIYDEFKIKGKQETKESELYIWRIPPTGEIAFRQVDLKPLWQQQNITLADLVTSSRESIGVRSRGGIEVTRLDRVGETKSLRQLDQLLISPIANLLPKDPNERVIFIPQESLFLVPFPALQNADGKYLIEEHTILSSPAIQVLQLTHQRRKRILNLALKRNEGTDMQIPQGADVLIVGNPTMPSVSPQIGAPLEPLPPLPFAQEEAEAIAQVMKTKAITGKQATKAAMIQLLPKSRLIHLATHSSFDNIPGFGSWIALAPSLSDNGILTADEILKLKLNAELIVLSACDTGQGKLTGDGVIGLSRALITAGVPSVMVSLWSVSDQSTKLLMTEFYRNLHASPDKAQALRQAMLVTMKQYPQPAFWAAFTLIGEAE